MNNKKNRSGMHRRQPVLNEEIETAILQDNIDSLKLLYKTKRFSIDERNAEGRTALHLAALYGRSDIVDYLCRSQGANIRALDDDHRTPLHLASQEGHLAVVQYICEKESFKRRYIDMRDNNNFSALCLAIENERLDVARYFCEKYRQAIKNDNEALLYAVMKNYLELLPAFRLTEDDKGKLLNTAAGFGHIQIVEYLCETLKTKVTGGYASNIAGKRALHVASEEGHLNIVEYLCVNFNAANKKNVTEFKESVTDGTIALHKAIKKGHHFITDYLCEEIKSGVDINQTVDRNSALQVAIQKNNLDALKCLLRQPNIDFKHVVNNLDKIKNNVLFKSIETEVKTQLSEIKKEDPLYSLVHYFRQWKPSHWCWSKIDPNRYVFAYMILKAQHQHERDMLIEKILASEKISSWSSNSFRGAIQHIYEKPVAKVWHDSLSILTATIECTRIIHPIPSTNVNI
jgi:ankyrin repeat protein